MPFGRSALAVLTGSDAHSSTNWMNALRRAFTRRYDGENPFYSLISVPIEPPAQRGRPSKALIAARLEDALYKAQLEAAEAEALANPSPKKEDTKPELETTVASTSTIPERVPADSTPAPETAGTFAAVPAEEDASPVKMDLDVDSKSDIKEEGSATPGPGMPVKPVRPTHQMAQKEIEWEDIALETKVRSTRPPSLLVRGLTWRNRSTPSTRSANGT